MAVSLLVPYAPGSDAWRDRLWDWVEACWRLLLPAAEVCIGTPDSSDAAGFNHAQAVNRAAAQAHGDVFVIAQPDTVHDREMLGWRIELARDGNAWTVPGLYSCLTEDATRIALSQDQRIDLAVLDREAETAFSWAGVAVMPREAFERVGGCDERFDGWSPDDVAFGVSVDTLWGEKARIGRVFHLWHPQPLNERYGRPGFDGARRLVDRYTGASGDRTAMQALIAERP
jgi:hypothetical protein